MAEPPGYDMGKLPVEDDSRLRSNRKDIAVEQSGSQFLSTRSNEVQTSIELEVFAQPQAPLLFARAFKGFTLSDADSLFRGISAERYRYPEAKMPCVRPQELRG
jgi:hypothetical protein